MRYFIACFVAFVFLTSFRADNRKVFYYPEFIVAYEQKILPGNPAWEGFENKVLVSGGVSSFLNGIDSVAVKYQIINDGRTKDVYTNFYSRAGEGKWNKYAADKKFLEVIIERRDDTAFVDDRGFSDYSIYYKVR